MCFGFGELTYIKTQAAGEFTVYITCKKEIFGKIRRHESARFLKKPPEAALCAPSVAACAGCDVEGHGCDWSADPFLLPV